MRKISNIQFFVMVKVTLLLITCLLLICHETQAKRTTQGTTSTTTTPIPVVNRLSDCVWNVNTDLPSNANQPLYINPSRRLRNTIYDITNFWLPQSRDEVRLKAGEKIMVACPNSFVQGHAREPKELILTCQHAKLLDAENIRYILAALTCKSQRMRPQVKVIGHIDQDDSNLGKSLTRAKIGFELTDGKFYETMEIRFNSHTKDTVYSKYLLTPEIRGIQTGRPGVDFLVANVVPFYVDARQVTSMYTNQNKALENQIGTTMPNDILSKGHFAANGDFVYRTLQTATFMYENTAPQWQKVNGNNWNALEDNCRQFVTKINRQIEVYTGVSDNLQLTDVRTSQLKFIFLQQIPKPTLPLEDFDIKVSKFFWKVLYDRNRKKGIAFAMVNNPFEVNRERTGIDELCTNICNTGDLNPDWTLTWNQNRYDYGYAICCAVTDMARNLPEIPNIDVSNGILNQ